MTIPSGKCPELAPNNEHPKFHGSHGIGRRMHEPAQLCTLHLILNSALAQHEAWNLKILSNTRNARPYQKLCHDKMFPPLQLVYFNVPGPLVLNHLSGTLRTRYGNNLGQNELTDREKIEKHDQNLLRAVNRQPWFPHGGA